MRSGPRLSRSRRDAPIRPGRRPCARRWERSSGCRSSRSTTLPAGASPSSRTAASRFTRSTWAETVTFVLGSEREGLPAEVAAACDAQATIPVEPGAESLNVAAAAALALYERRNRG